MKASDLIVQCLEAEGIEVIFGVPGEENADMMMSLQSSEKIQFVLCRHEQGAAFMADAYGRITGMPAGCLSTLGPGATNLITAVANGNMDRAPMLVLTGQGSTDRLHKESHQIMDVVRMYEPVTKWAHSIRNENTIPEVVRKAVRLARSEKPGAVLIELPEDVAKRDADIAPMAPRRYRRPVTDDKAVERAWELIRTAKSPLIIAGNGCIRKRASKQLRQFCDTTGIGVVSTFMAKGCVDMDAPYCLYSIGLQGKDHIFRAIDAADLILTLGFDMVEYPPSLWNPDVDKKIIHADFLPAEIDTHYHPEAELIGDLAHTLWMLNEKVALDPLPAFEFSSQRRVREDMGAELQEHADDSEQGPVRPQKVLWECRRALGPSDILLSDVGAHKMWIGRHYHCHEPNTCLIPNGFCSMGFALPGAISVWMSKPESKVVAICGDAGFLMNCQEMETARRLGANITVMVWEDRSYGLIAWKQDNEFGSHTDLEFDNPDWEQLASAFGWQFHSVGGANSFRPALDSALAESGPSLVVVPIDYRENNKLTKRLGDIACSI